MMRRWWHYLLLGLVAWLLFMVWRLPAGVAYAMVAKEQPWPVELVGLHDTVWDGGALQLQYQGRFVASTSWQVSPWGLLLGRLDASIRLLGNDSELEARLEMPVTGGEVALSNIRGRLPLSLLQQYLTMIPLPLKGEASLKLDQLALDAEGRVLAAQGRIVWYRAGVQMAEVVPLGDLQMNLKSVEGGIEGNISDSGGPLQLNATLRLDTSGGYRLTGSVSPNEGAAESLRGMLPMLGQADNQGSYPLNFSGSL